MDRGSQTDLARLLRQPGRGFSVAFRCLALMVLAAPGFAADYHQTQIYQNQTNQNQIKIRQLQVEQRMNQIQQEMQSPSGLTRSSVTPVSPASGAVFSPTLPGYPAPVLPAARTNPVNAEQVASFLAQLGNPEEGSGIYAYPPEVRLYHYGLMCIDVGFIEEGVRAITEHTRIQAERSRQQSDKTVEPRSSSLEESRE